MTNSPSGPGNAVPNLPGPPAAVPNLPGPPAAAPRIDTTTAHSARIWNYWLGGKDNYPVDRAVGDQIRGLHPGIEDYARGDRVFLGRAVQYMAREAGIRQFLDIGTGLPSADNTHQVAQSIAPESRIVYVDNDPLVLAHARACSPAPPRARAITSTRIYATPARSWPKRPGR